jgi:tellurite resistance protein
MSEAISHHTALIYAMVLVSAADAEMTDSELRAIGDVVTHFPIFNDFDPERLVGIAEECASIFSEDGGLDAVLGLIEQGLDDKLKETVYAAAVEVATADEVVNQEELRILELLRHRLGIDRLYAGAIERSARARHTTL